MLSVRKEKEGFGLIKLASNDDSAADAGFAGIGYPAPDRDRSRAPEGGRPDSNRNLEDHDLGCCRYTTTTMRGCRLLRRRFDHPRI